MKTRSVLLTVLLPLLVLPAFVLAQVEEDSRVQFTYDRTNGTGLYINDFQRMGTLRVYGQEDEDAAFPYTDPAGPFDPRSPQAPVNDFITWNPAYMSETLAMDDAEFFAEAIAVNGRNANEKVFLRQWYVPEYPEPRGETWDPAERVRATQDIVKEYTFLLLDGEDQPVSAAVQSSFVFPTTYHSLDQSGTANSQIGLEGWDVNMDGRSDRTVLYGIEGNTITIGTAEYITLREGDSIEFLDHRVEIETVNSSVSSSKVAVKIYYSDAFTHEVQIGSSHVIEEKETLAVGRHLVSVPDMPTPIDLPWYIYVDAVDPDDHLCFVTVGRILQEGETFFVDGAEYDVARIFIDSEGLKYITIRNPLPKCTNDPDDLVFDRLSVTKACVSAGIENNLPLLPPFNRAHAVRDDVNGERGLVQDVPAAIEYWVSETDEPRFTGTLWEVLRETVPETFIDIPFATRPDWYTELVLPLQEDYNDESDLTVHGDYLLTSPFMIPDSEDDERVSFFYDASPIYEGLTDIYINGNLRVYGQDSLDAAFPYTDPVGPFDPGSNQAPPRDFVTWNPAYMSETLAMDDAEFFAEALSVNGSNANEKVFLRQWYVPEYPEPRGDTWGAQPTVVSADIVKEYSYMLLDAFDKPVTADVGSSFVFPAAYTSVGGGSGPGQELCLIVDGSGSMSEEEFQLQVEGLAQAVADPGIVPQNGSVVISVVQFSAGATVEVVPTLIDSPTSANEVADLIRAISFQNGSWTRMDAAINLCMEQFSDGSREWIIDMSTDGDENGGSDAIGARDAAVAVGLDVLNALGVGDNIDVDFLEELVWPQPASAPYEPGFVDTADDFTEFAQAMGAKISGELGERVNRQVGLEDWDFDHDGAGDTTFIHEIGKDYVKIGTGLHRLYAGESLEFLDHRVVISDINASSGETGSSKVYVDIYYPNRFNREVHLGSYIIEEGETLVAGRHAYNIHVPGVATPITSPWYIYVDAVNSANHTLGCYAQVGRIIKEGESFFVDGAEYDVARVFTVGNPHPGSWKLKYITLRNPLPKCGKSIWLDILSVEKECIAEDEDPIPMLPPFNREHAVRDDVNGEAGLVIDVPAVEEYWVAETIEPRFSGTLYELLEKNPAEDFDSYDFWTRPDMYTAFDMPRQNDYPETRIGDYILTSSWLMEKGTVADTYCIQAVVSGTDGLDVSGVLIQVSGAGSCTTGTDGTCEVCGLADGTYTVGASKAGYDIDPVQGSVSVGDEPVEVVSFSATEQPTPVEDRFSIAGLVRSAEDDSPIGGAVVTIRLSSNGAETSVTTGADGTYAFSDILEGDYVVRAEAEGFVAAQATLTLDADKTDIDFDLDPSQDTGGTTTGTTGGSSGSSSGGSSGGSVTVDETEADDGGNSGDAGLGAEEEDADQGGDEAEADTGGDEEEDTSPAAPAGISIAESEVAQGLLFARSATITIKAEGTTFASNAAVSFEPDRAVRLVRQQAMDDDTIVCRVRVRPAWMTRGIEGVTVKVSTGAGLLETSCSLKVLSLPLSTE